MLTGTLPNEANFTDLGNLISRVAHSLATSRSMEAGKVHAQQQKDH